MAGFFRDIYFRKFLLVAKRFREILGATPSLRSAPTCFGLIAKILFAKIASVSNSRKYRSANPPGYTVFKIQERESDRSKEIEQRKELQKHTNKTTGTRDPKY